MASRALLTVAVPKGRLLEESSTLFERALGVSPRKLLEGTRKLAADAPQAGLRFISIRAGDVACYVEHGAAEVGIVGLDVLREDPVDLYALSRRMRAPSGASFCSMRSYPRSRW